LDVEDLLHGDLDLGLVRARVHDERVLALVEQPVGLLGHDRCDQDVAGVLTDAHFSSSEICWADSPPAGAKPAVFAASAERNQTSASVASYQREPATWYFIE